jgi:hypothetical protein
MDAVLIVLLIGFLILGWWFVRTCAEPERNGNEK